MIPNYTWYKLKYGLLHVNPNLVQLNSGSTNFNTTLNLTGPILLGLGIAAATLFYAYFNAFKGLVVKPKIFKIVNSLYPQGLSKISAISLGKRGKSTCVLGQLSWRDRGRWIRKDGQTAGGLLGGRFSCLCQAPVGYLWVGRSGMVIIKHVA